ncbi:hypothetical protein EYV94_22970 [Puteibacter caeruleilacunae]|nr:hypothetical protein EYV94_22970 [Puteibacter caeruleilacunae]
MRRIRITLLILIACISYSQGQSYVVKLNSAESGNQTHTAHNSIIFESGYTYTANGGSLTANIVAPTFSTVVSNTPPLINDRTLNTSLHVGTIEGVFDVNRMGGATYSIPITVPDGPNGINPNISLNYSSNNSEGLAGFGWNIGGVSCIERGPQTVYYDGVSKAISMSYDDRFYVDGQRLVAISGVYGQDNTEYRTEQDIISRFKSYSVLGSGPRTFKEERKNGVVVEYGHTPESAEIPVYNSSASKWYVSSIKDRNNNRIDYTYLVGSDKKVYPANIDFGHYSIVFDYKKKEYLKGSYLLSHYYINDLLLSQIEVRYNDKIVKKIELKYQESDHKYLLNELVEYGANDIQVNSTLFHYITPENLYFDKVEAGFVNSIVAESKVTVGDFDGDGLSDLFCVAKDGEYQGWKLLSGRGDNNFDFKFDGSLTGNINEMEFYPVDLDGDGDDDLIYDEYIGDGKHRIKYTISHSTSFFISNQEIIGKYQLQIGDFDGNGLNDVLVFDKYKNWKIYSVSQSDLDNLSLQYSGVSNLFNGLKTVLVGKWDSDEKTDIAIFDDSGSNLMGYRFVNNKFHEIAYINLDVTKDDFFRLGDFNGDGLTDVFYYGSTTTEPVQWEIRLTKEGQNYGNTHIRSIDRLSDYASLRPHDVEVVDLTGDGVDDLLVREDDGQGAIFRTIYVVEQRIPNSTEMDLHKYNGPLGDDQEVDKFGDFDGDGAKDIFSIERKIIDVDYRIYKSNDNSRILLTDILDGINKHTQIDYGYLSQGSGSFYTKAFNGSYPFFYYNGALPVVTSMEYDNWKGEKNRVEYSYERAIMHRLGKHFLTFGKVTKNDIAKNTKKIDEYSFQSPYCYPYLSKSTIEINNLPIKVTNNTWGYKSPTNKTFFPYLSTVVQEDKIANNSVTITSNYDNYGNKVYGKQDFGGGRTITTNVLYNNNTSAWLLGRPTNTTVTYVGDGSTITKQTSRIFNSVSNLLEQETLLAGSSKALVKKYNYFDNGMVKDETIEGSGQSRVTSYLYKDDGIHVASKTDPLNHVTTYDYNDIGLLWWKEDFKGNRITYEYDSFGRISKETYSDGRIVNKNMRWATTGGPTHAVYYEEVLSNVAPMTSKTWYDITGNELRNEYSGFDGNMIKVDKEYFDDGKLAKVSDPYTSGAAQFSIYAYDDPYNMLTSISHPSGRTLSHSYGNEGNLLKATSTQEGIVTARFYDNRQLLTKATRSGKDIIYTYYPDGNLKKIQSPDNVITSFEYDLAGNKTKMIDPSAGTVTYGYNNLGQLTSQVIGGQTTSFSYHSDGRLLSKTGEGTWTYSYGTSDKLLESISKGSSFTRTFGYKSDGKVGSVTDKIDGVNYTTQIDYDSKGRISQKTHPSGSVELLKYNTISQYMDEIWVGSKRVWKITGMNARNQVDAAIYGDNLNGTFTYNAFGNQTQATVGAVQNYQYLYEATTGNMTERKNNKINQSESFAFDGLNRLTSINHNSNVGSIAYFDNGNIQNKYDAGTNFTYTQSGNPYALTGLTTTGSSISSHLQDIEYNSFQSVSSISEGSYSAAFNYNCDEQRCIMEVKNNSTTILKRVYAGNSYVKETEGGVTKEYTWIGGDAYTAPVVAIKQGGTTTCYAMLRDHLGSITHQVKLFNGGSSLTQEFSYDAWGRQRNPSTWISYTPGSEPSLVAGRGFSGHEHLKWFGLINMNGRLYDPVVGRFLSPDNNIQYLDFTENLNRYSYCLNNPLKYNDPSGEFFAELVYWIGATVGNYLMGVADNKINNNMSWSDSFKNANFVVTANVGLSDGSITNPQVENHKIAKHEEKVISPMIDNKIGEMKEENMIFETYEQHDFIRGFGLSFEIAFPKKIVGGVSDTKGIGFDFGIFEDEYGQGFYFTKKKSTKGGVAFGIAIEEWKTKNRSSFQLNGVSRDDIKGKGYETSFGLGPYGGAYGTDASADDNLEPMFKIQTISYGVGIDVGYVDWKTETYVTGK